MGYYADGSGSITFDCILDDKTHDDLMDKFGKTFETCEYSEFGDSSVINFSSYMRNYYEDEVLDALDIAVHAAPIKEGEVRYSGEGEDFWRFVFDDNRWTCESGQVEYGDHPIPYKRLVDAIRKFADNECDLYGSAEVYRTLKEFFEFSDEDLRLLGFDWLFDLVEDGAAE